MQDGALCHRSKVATEDKQDLCAGMDQEQSTSESWTMMWTIMKDRVVCKKPSGAASLFLVPPSAPQLVSEDEQDFSAGMAREQLRNKSTRESVDYYEG